MKFKIIYWLSIMLLIMFVTISYSGSGSDSGENTILTVEKSVAYNIPKWNASGSFPVVGGTMKIGSSGETVCFIRILDKDKNIITELTPQKLQNKINNIDMALFNNKPSKTRKRKIENYKSSLNEIKKILENPEKFHKLLMRLKSINTNTIQGTLDWSINVDSNVRDYDLNVNGTLSD